MADRLKSGPLRIGQIFDRSYRIERLLGSGGQASVYEATQIFMNRRVAIKVFHPPTSSTDEEHLRRMRTEATSTARAQHENIVEIIHAAIADEEGLLFIVMELLEGRPSRDGLDEQGRFSVGQTLHIMKKVAAALVAAHTVSVIHRDIKPDNIFILPGNLIKLVDFGIAKVMDAAQANTQKDVVLGTINYMSPEQVQAKTVTPSTDLYSAGLTAYEFLSGVQPIKYMIQREGKPLSLFEISRLIVKGRPPKLHELVPDMPLSVSSLVARCMAKDPEQRFKSAQELLEELEKCDSGHHAEVKARGFAVVLIDLSRPRNRVDPFPRTDF